MSKYAGVIELETGVVCKGACSNWPRGVGHLTSALGARVGALNARVYSSELLDSSCFSFVLLSCDGDVVLRRFFVDLLLVNGLLTTALLAF